ncbi:MAG: hypothetical protein HY554_05675 [Elusimicrobia bacterium]|nr:hypothetical protein [Elusimicrobiota bacterium]
MTRKVSSLAVCLVVLGARSASAQESGWPAFAYAPLEAADALPPPPPTGPLTQSSPPGGAASVEQAYPSPFQPSLAAFLAEARCDAPAACRLPSVERTRDFLESFAAGAPGRIAVYQDVLALAKGLSDTLQALGRRQGATASFGAVYQKAAELVPQRLKEFGIEETMRLLGPGSPIEEKLRALLARIEKWEGLLASASDPDVRAAFLAQARADYGPRYRDLRSYAWGFDNAAGKSAVDPGLPAFQVLRDLTFPLGAHLRFGEGCTEEAGAPFIARLAPTTLTHEAVGLSLVDDWRVVKALLEGSAQSPGAITVRCPTQGGRSAVSYDARTRTLTYPKQVSSRLVFPGSGGDLNFHLRRDVSYPAGGEAVVGLLRSQLGR